MLKPNLLRTKHSLPWCAMQFLAVLCLLTVSRGTVEAQPLTFRISGHVLDASGNLVARARVLASDSMTETFTDGAGAYSLTVPATLSLTLQAFSPVGSTPLATPAFRWNLSGPDTTLNLVLAPLVKVAGQLTDGTGSALPNSTFTLRYIPTGFAPAADLLETTDSAGRYAFEVPPGTYAIHVPSDGISDRDNLPSYFDFWLGPFDLGLATQIDVRLPSSLVSIHVQDPAGLPVANAEVQSALPNSPTCGGGVLGNFVYNTCALTRGRMTDGAGNTSVWLFPASYSLIAEPAATSPYYRGSPQVVTVPNATSTVLLVLYTVVDGGGNRLGGAPTPGATPELDTVFLFAVGAASLAAIGVRRFARAHGKSLE